MGLLGENMWLLGAEKDWFVLKKMKLKQIYY